MCGADRDPDNGRFRDELAAVTPGLDADDGQTAVDTVPCRVPVRIVFALLRSRIQTAELRSKLGYSGSIAVKVCPAQTLPAELRNRPDESVGWTLERIPIDLSFWLTRWNLANRASWVYGASQAPPRFDVSR